MGCIVFLELHFVHTSWQKKRGLLESIISAANRKEMTKRISHQTHNRATQFNAVPSRKTTDFDGHPSFDNIPYGFSLARCLTVCVLAVTLIDSGTHPEDNLSPSPEVSERDSESRGQSAGSREISKLCFTGENLGAAVVRTQSIERHRIRRNKSTPEARAARTNKFFPLCARASETPREKQQSEACADCVCFISNWFTRWRTANEHGRFLSGMPRKRED
jgi:hypothetical protein